MPTEKNITAGIMRYLKAHGAWAVKLHGGPFQQAGLPDILCILDGVVMFFEVKTPTGKPTMIQTHCHEQIRKAGGRVAIVRSVADVQLLVNCPDNADIWSKPVITDYPNPQNVSRN